MHSHFVKSKQDHDLVCKKKQKRREKYITKGFNKRLDFKRRGPLGSMRKTSPLTMTKAIAHCEFDYKECMQPISLLGKGPDWQYA